MPSNVLRPACGEKVPDRADEGPGRAERPLIRPSATFSPRAGRRAEPAGLSQGSGSPPDLIPRPPGAPPPGAPPPGLLPDGRLHLQHGPIDLILGAFGPADAVRRAYRAAAARFSTVLGELCGELAALRSPAGTANLDGAVARRMAAAVAPLAEAGFITPMAAVAGAVADEILGTMTGAAPLARAFVNNGGDVALHLAPGEALMLGLVDRPDRPSLLGRLRIGAGDVARGVATSGWRGRSFSLGIADAVTILARTGAEADAAATAIANAVDLGTHPAVLRVPARAVQADSDLGHRLVTRDVGPLTDAEVALALRRGLARAHALLARGLILGAVLHLRGVTETAGALALLQGAEAPQSGPLPCPTSFFASAC